MGSTGFKLGSSEQYALNSYPDSSYSLSSHSLPQLSFGHPPLMPNLLPLTLWQPDLSLSQTTIWTTSLIFS